MLEMAQGQDHLGAFTPNRKYLGPSEGSGSNPARMAVADYSR